MSENRKKVLELVNGLIEEEKKHLLADQRKILDGIEADAYDAYKLSIKTEDELKDSIEDYIKALQYKAFIENTGGYVDDAQVELSANIFLQIYEPAMKWINDRELSYATVAEVLSYIGM